MKKVMMVSCVWAAGVAFAAGLPSDVSALGLVTNGVPRGETRSVESAIAVGNNLFLKTGDGRLTVDVGRLESPGVARFGVAGGTLALTNAGLARAKIALDDAVKAKLGFWFAADDATHISKDGDDVNYWYDVRETNTASPSYPYAAQDNSLKNGQKPTCVDCTSAHETPAVTYRAIHFGGIGSGVRMKVIKSGSGYCKAAKTAYVVYGVETDTRIGHVFGSSRSGYVPLLPSGLWDGGTAYFMRSAWGPVTGSRCWLDGTQIDAQVTPVKKGFHILGIEPNGYGKTEDTFICALMSTGETDKTKQCGGEYVSEILWFTKVLTESERLNVERYLNMKYFASRAQAINADLAAGTQLEVDVPEGATFSGVDIRAAGSGAFVKKGAGTLQLVGAAPAKGELPVTIQGGAVAFSETTPFVKPTAGTAYAATTTADGTTVSTAAATAGSVVKEGAANLAMDAIGAGVTKLEVRGGTLAIGAKRAANVDTACEVPLQNPGFEPTAMSATAYEWAAFDVVKKPAGSLPGWTAGVEGTSGGEAVWYSHAKWTAKGKSNYYGGPIGWVGHYNDNPPPEGEAALVLSNGAYAETPVEIAEAGWYEVHLQARAFQNGTSAYTGIRVTLRNGDGSLAADLGGCRIDSTGDFVRRVVSGRVMTPGNYTLRLSVYKPYNEGVWSGTNPNKDSYVGSQLNIDDIAMRKMPDAMTDWPIPGGDFETAQIPTCGDANVIETSYATSFVNTNGAAWTVLGWTFPAPTSSGARPDAGPATAWTTSFIGSGRWNPTEFDTSRSPRGGNVQMVMTGVSPVTTTFVAPAGTHYLKARLADYADREVGKYSSLKAAVTIDGATTDLGTVLATQRRLDQFFVWPTPFVADGTKNVTLTLTLVKKNTATNVACWRTISAFRRTPMTRWCRWRRIRRSRRAFR